MTEMVAAGAFDRASLIDLDEIDFSSKLHEAPRNTQWKTFADDFADFPAGGQVIECENAAAVYATFAQRESIPFSGGRQALSPMQTANTAHVRVASVTV